MTSLRADLPVQALRLLHLATGAHPQGLGHLGAASGLVRLGRRLFVVADDEHHLGSFDLDGDSPVQLHRLREHDLPAADAARKSAKPDLEVLLHLPPELAGPHGALLALGSGSGPRRNGAMKLPLDAEGRPTGSLQALSLEPLYTPLREHFGDLNIEGGFFDGDVLVLLQRGNRSGTPNASLRYGPAQVRDWLAGGTAGALPQVRTFELGQVDGVTLAFTDGTALAGGRWAYSAVAEDSADSWADGACVGAVVGIVDASGRIVTQRRLQPTCKVEGITAREVGGEVELLMVTDADDPAVPAQLVRARLPAPAPAAADPEPPSRQ